MSVATTAAITPTNTEICVPLMALASTSRPEAVAAHGQGLGLDRVLGLELAARSSHSL
jgi:hypothetical protein